MSYVTVQDMRNAGVPASIGDDQIQLALDTWQSFIERATRQFFEERSATLDVDGNDGTILFMPVPVVTVTELYVNGDFTTQVNTDRYKVYNKRGGTEVQDDRKNPKIQLASAGLGLFDLPRTHFGPVFLKGTRNQRIVGSFGYVEADGSTPPLIKHALLKLSILKLQEQNANCSPWTSFGSSLPSGKIMSETTDGHSITYDAFRVSPSKAGLSGITGDQEIDRILDLYRAPIAMAVPGSYEWYRG